MPDLQPLIHDLQQQLNEARLRIQELENQLSTTAHIQRYQGIVEDQTELICRYDTNFNLTFVNRAYSDSFGTTPEALIGTCFIDRIPQEDRDAAINKIKSLTVEHPASISEHKSIMPDQSLRWIEWRDRAIYDENGHIIEYQGVGRDITDLKKQNLLQQSLSNVLEAIASNLSLTEIFEKLIKAIETHQPNVKASILLVNAETQTLQHGSAPSLPKSYTDAINGEKIGPKAGSCGTAAYVKHLVVVEDIETSPLWDDYRDLARAHNLAACWSQPIFDQHGLVLGTFAMYYDHPNAPDAAELELVKMAAHTAGIAIHHKREQDELRANEEKHRSLLESSDAAITLVHQDGTYLYLNPIAAMPFQVPPAELVGKSVNDLFDTDTAEKILSDVRKVISDDTGMVIETNLTFEDRLCWFRTSIQPVRDAYGKPYAAFIYANEFTDKKLAELALHEKETQQRAILQAIPDLMFRLNADGTFIDYHAPSDALLIIPPTNFLGKQVQDILPTELADKLIPTIQNVLETGQLISFDYALDLNDVPYEFEARVVRVNEAEVLILIRDVTERKKAEQELESLYNATGYLLQADTIKTLGQQIVNAVVGEFAHVDCGLMLVDNDTRTLIRLARSGSNKIQTTRSLTLDGPGLVPLAVRSGLTVYVPDVTHDKNYAPNESSTRSELVIPLKTNQGVIAVLDLQRQEINGFSPRDQRLLTAYAERAAAALETMQLHEQVNRHAEELEQRVNERTLELERIKNRVEAILNHSGDGILLVDVEKGIQQVNHTFNTLFQTSEPDYVDKPLTVFIHSGDVEYVETMIQNVVMTHSNHNLQVHALRHDGTAFDAEISLAPISDLFDTVTGIVCIVRDISERMRTQDAILRMNADLESVIESTDTGFTLLDQEGIIRVISQRSRRFAQEAGAPIPEVGKKFASYIPEALRHIFEERFTRALKGEEIATQRESTVDGKKKLYVTYYYPVRTPQGEIIGVNLTTRDITEEKETEQKLRYLASLQGNMYDAVIATDMNEHVLSWNKAAERMYGWTAEEALGKHISKNLLNAHYGKALNVRNHLRQHGAWEGEVMHHRSDGTPIPVMISMSLLRDEAGNPSGIVSVNHDITERKQTEDEIRRYQADLQSILNSTNTAFFLLDKHGAFRLVNALGYELYQQFYGLIPKIGAKFVDSVPEKEGDAFTTRLQEAVRGPTITSQFTRTIHGQTRHFVATYHPARSADGEVLGVNVAVRDATDERENEQKLRYLASLQANMNDAVIGTDFDYVVRSWNKAADRMYGWTAEEVIGRPLYSLIRTEFMNKETSNSTRNQLFEKGIWEGEVIQYHKKGHAINILASIVVLKDDDGRPIGIMGVNHDITERKQAQDALKDSEERYRLLAENVTDLISKHDSEGVYTFATSSIQPLLGYTPEEVIGRSAYDFFHPEDLERIQESHTFILDQASPFTVAYRIRRKDGAYIWFESTSHTIRDSQNGAIIEIISTSRDITERKLAEEALAQKYEDEHEMQNYLKALHEIGIELTRTETLDEFYRRVVELGLERFGFDRMGLLLYHETTGRATGTYGTDIQGNIIAEHGIEFDPAGFTGILNQTKNRNRRFAYLSNVPLYTIHEEVVATGWVAAAALWNGHVLGWLSIDNAVHHRPATQPQLEIFSLFAMTVGSLLARKHSEAALRSSEERYRTLITTMSEGIVLQDQNGVIQASNAAAEEILGLTVNQMMGLSSLDPQWKTIHEDGTPFPGESHPAMLTLKQGKPITNVVMGVYKPDEELRWISINSSPVIDDGDEKPSAVVTTLSDITHRKNYEQTLENALAQEKELGELKSRFVSMASHEFRTPLASILALTETLLAYRKRLTDEQMDTRLEKIQDQVIHLKSIIEDVLQLARIQARRVEIKPQRLNLDSLCQSVIDEFVSHPDFKHRVIYHCDETLQSIELDKTIMRQIISNLMSNAVKYSPDGQTITISLTYDNDLITLKVHDEGIGIPEADLKHLFQPFHRASNVGAISGTGLGLVITKESIELHGGKIVVESQVGIGTTFIVTIPAAKTES